jgi:hypothetical protein
VYAADEGAGGAGERLPGWRSWIEGGGGGQRGRGRQQQQQQQRRDEGEGEVVPRSSPGPLHSTHSSQDGSLGG